MSTHEHNPGRPAVLLLALLLLLQTTLAARMVPNHSQSNSSFLDDALGSARALAASHFYERADLYFHRGVPHSQARAMRLSWFESVHRTIAPSEHTHAEGDNVADILPWLIMAVRTDPAGEDAYMIAAHWLSKSLGRHDEALQLLRSGLLTVQHPYLLLIGRGKILLRQQAWGPAENALATAVQQLQANHPSPESDAFFDLREALLLHAFASEAAGHVDSCVKSLAAYLAVSETPVATLHERLRILTAGGTPTPHASTFFAAHDRDQHDIACGRANTSAEACSDHAHENCSHD
jgi:hypothetical protein